MSLGIGGIVSVGGGTGGGGSGSASGITEINGQIGPVITIVGVNGISVTVPVSNTILIDGVALSGTVTKYAASFAGITSGIFTHNLGTEDVIVQIYTLAFPRMQMWPDKIKIENSNQVSVLYNSPQSGRIIIMG
jgi:hypothetical protein